MTAPAFQPIPETRGQRITRRLGTILGHFGVDPLQYHWLLQTSLKLDFRSAGPMQRGSSSTRSALRTAILLNFFYSGMMSLILMATANSFFFTVMMIGYGMAMVAMMILLEFGLVVISPDDYLILAHRPISSRTFLAVRFSNLLFYVMSLGLSLNIAPALMGLATHGATAWFPLVYLAVSMLAMLFVAGAIVGIYGLLMRRMNIEKFKDLLAYCQMAFSFAFFFGFQIIPRMATRTHGFTIDKLSHSWAVAFPSLWFAGLVELGLGHVSRPALLNGAAAVVLVFLVIPVLFRSVSLDYSEQLGRITTSSAKSARATTGAEKKIGWFGRFFRKYPRDPEERAFFQFIVIMLRRNRRLKLQLFPNFGYMLAVLVIGLLDPATRADPFAGDGMPGITLSFAGMAFVLGSMALAISLPYSDEFAGAWVFQVAPISRPAVILRAAKKAAFLFLMFPLMVICSAIFSFFWPITHAMELSVYGVLGGLIAFNLALLRFRGFPFTKKPEKGTQSRQFSMFMILFVALGLVFILPMLLPHAKFLLGIIFVLMLGTWIGLDQLSNRVFARRKPELE